MWFAALHSTCLWTAWRTVHNMSLNSLEHCISTTTSLCIWSSHIQHWTPHAFEQFGALCMYYLDHQNPVGRPQLKLGTFWFWFYRVLSGPRPAENNSGYMSHYMVLLNMKGCIGYFNKCPTHPFISKAAIYVFRHLLKQPYFYIFNMTI